MTCVTNCNEYIDPRTEAPIRTLAGRVGATPGESFRVYARRERQTDGYQADALRCPLYTWTAR